MTATTSFLNFHFAKGSRTTFLAEIVARADRAYGYVVTPNVDFAVRAASDEEAQTLYDGAILQICDSRVLASLARLKGVKVDCCPGSDLVADLLATSTGLTIAAVGPSEADWESLVARFPEVPLILIPSCMMVPGEPTWSAALAEALSAPWDILLICLGSPKQERFARALGDAGRSKGLAFCVGASIDFLTGRQRRAPAAMQALRIEWLYRLSADPRRLWRRYLLGAPRLLRLMTGG